MLKHPKILFCLCNIDETIPTLSYQFKSIPSEFIQLFLTSFKCFRVLKRFLWIYTLDIYYQTSQESQYNCIISNAVSTVKMLILIQVNYFIFSNFVKEKYEYLII